MGSGNVDYSQQVKDALAQSNLPKSPLANQTQNAFGSIMPDVMRALLNTQRLGNSFINSNVIGGGYKPPTVSTDPFTISPPTNQNPPPQNVDSIFGPTSPNDNRSPSSPGITVPGGPNINMSPGDMGLLGGISNLPVPTGQIAFDPAAAGSIPTAGIMPGVGSGAGVNVNPMVGGPMGIPQFPNFNPSGLPGGDMGIPGNVPGGIPGSPLGGGIQLPGGPPPDVGNPGSGIGNPISSEPGFGNGTSTVPYGGNVNVDQFGNPLGVTAPGIAQANFNGMGGPNLSNSISSLLQNVGGANLSGVPNSLQLTPQNSQYMDAISNILGKQFNQNIADLRERQIDTGTSRSTGNIYDEQNLRSSQYPQLVAALNQARQPEVANQLQQASLMQSGLLGNAGLQGQNLSTLLSGQLGQSGLLSDISKFNAGQQNTNSLALTGLNQQAVQQSIQNQLQALMSLFGSGFGMAMGGVPGGSANVNIGNSSGGGGGLGGIGSMLGGLGSLLGAI